MFIIHIELHGEGTHWYILEVWAQPWFMWFIGQDILIIQLGGGVGEIIRPIFVVDLAEVYFE